MSNDSNAKCVMIKLLDAALFYNIGRHGNVGKCKQPWQYFFKSLKVVPMYLKNIEDWIGWNHVKYYFNLLKSIGNKKNLFKACTCTSSIACDENHRFVYSNIKRSVTVLWGRSCCPYMVVQLILCCKRSNDNGALLCMLVIIIIKK